MGWLQSRRLHYWLGATAIAFVLFALLRVVFFFGFSGFDANALSGEKAVLETLGMSDLDPYRLGFSPRLMLIVVALLTLGLFYLRSGLAVVMLASATLAFIIGIKPSHNYWDYLVDPLLGLYCCAALLMLATRWTIGRLRTLISSARHKSA